MAGLVPFTIDLLAHEGVRLAAVLDALGPDWDPAAIFVSETEARRLLYADLDSTQQATFDVLVAAGVLSDIPERLT